MPKLKTLIIDNYDSFTFNLFQYIGELKGNPVVRRNDEISLTEIAQLAPTHIIISPGPGRPDDPDYFGVNLEVIHQLSTKIPTLGVCLGHQGICYAFGGKVIRAPQIMHGKTSQIKHDKVGLFKNLKNPLTAMRYHSLIIEKKSVPKCLKITATSPSSPPVKGGLGGVVVMAVQHETSPLFGIQFHPESIGTPAGKRILKNFLAVKGK